MNAQMDNFTLDTKLTKFQLWTLFVTFNQPSTSFKTKDLLLQCCDSAIVDLQKENVEKELYELTGKGYLEDQFDGRYRITEDGILYVRQLHIALCDKVSNNKIPQEVISKQDRNVADEIKNHILNLATIISSGIKNIGPIVDLIHAAFRFPV